MNFVAFERVKQGTGASRRLRNTGRTPGIIYGGAAAPQVIELDHNNLWHALKKEAFHSSILELDLAGKKQKVLLRDVQYHPFKQLVLHIDFQRVDAKTKLHMKVPLHYINEDQSAAIKTDNCQITHVVNELEVSCMPSDLPEFIEVDLSGLKKGSSFHLKDVKIPRRVTAVIKGGKINPLLVSVSPIEAELTAEELAAAAEAAAAKAAAPKEGKGKKK